MDTPVDRPLRIFLFATGSVAVFAMMNLFVKLASETQSVPQIMFFRNALALLPILILMARMDNFDVFRTKRPLGHLRRGIVGLFSMGCGFASMALLPMAQATAIGFASPLILTVLSVFLLKEQVGPHRWTAVVVGLLSVLFMLHPAGGGLLGSALALAAAFFAALAMINVRLLGATEHALTIVFYFTVTGTLAGFAAMWFFWHPVTPAGLFWMILTGLAGGIGQVLLTYSYAHAPAAYVSSFSYLAIVFSALFDYLIWHYVPDWRTVAGSGVIIASGIYVIFRELARYGRTRSEPIAIPPSGPTDRDERDPL